MTEEQLLAKRIENMQDIVDVLIMYEIGNTAKWLAFHDILDELRHEYMDKLFNGVGQFVPKVD